MENKIKSIAMTAILVLGIYSLVQMQATEAYAASFMSLNASASNNFTSKDAKYTITAKIATRNFIKTMTITFPAGYDVSGASFDGMEGMREDGKLTISGQTLTYTNPRPVRLNPERIVTISIDKITNPITEGSYTISVATKDQHGVTVDSGTAGVLISSDITTNDADDITIENVAGDISLIASDDINITADDDVNINADGTTIRLDAATDGVPEITITDTSVASTVDLIANLTLSQGHILVSDGTIHSSGTIESDNDLIADDSIEAGTDITAGNDIEAGDDVIAGGNFHSDLGNVNLVVGSVNLLAGGVNAPVGTITGLTVNGGTVNAGALTVGGGGLATGIALAKVGASLAIDAALDVDGSIEAAGLNIPTGTITLPAGEIDGNEIADNTLTNADIADSFMKFMSLSDGTSGWIPDGSATDFTISDTSVTATSVISISVDQATALSCGVYDLNAGSNFKIKCTAAPANGATLNYVLMIP